VCQLGLSPGQDRMVAPAAYTVAEAHYYGSSALLRAIAQDGRIVGVLWVQTDEATPYLVRFMVDRAVQRQGVGKRALALLLDELRDGGYDALELSYVPVEGGAEGFWLGCGFAPTGREHGGEKIVRMEL
jgi:diamine N-acetyltransferase